MTGNRADVPMELDLAAWGKVITLETTGRHSGRVRRVTIGYAVDGEAYLVAASSDTTAWALNLAADPHYHVKLLGTRRSYTARPLRGTERETAIVALILKYGAPAERLGGGPAFRLLPD
jgi:deazaflavin-dependent oxidoreductase (nitroreductase family)